MAVRARSIREPCCPVRSLLGDDLDEQVALADPTLLGGLEAGVDEIAEFARVERPPFVFVVTHGVGSGSLDADRAPCTCPTGCAS